MIPTRQHLAFVGLAFAAACTRSVGHKPQDQASEGVQATVDCRSTLTISPDWPQFDAKRLPVRFRLPPGTVEQEAPEGQNWRLPGGSFAYRMSPQVPPAQDTGRPTPWCATEVAGRRTALRYFFGEATFGKRGYLTAEIPMSNDSVMEVIASTYDSAGVDTLVAIMRAVEIGGH